MGTLGDKGLKATKNLEEKNPMKQIKKYNSYIIMKAKISNESEKKINLLPKN